MTKTDISICGKYTPMIGKSANYSCVGKEYTGQGCTPHENQYFVMGNNRIIINEHFKDDGIPLESILGKVILNAGNSRKTA